MTDIVKISNSQFLISNQLPNSNDKISGEKAILQLAASIENKSEHSLAEAVVKRAKQENLELLEIKDFGAIPGHGVKGNIKISDVEYSVLFGNKN